MDVLILIIGLVGSLYLQSIDTSLSLIVLFVVCHFFLFCNIIRMSRIPELIWAANFLVFCVGSIQLNLLSLKMVFLISVVLTLVLTVYEFQKPSYHGVFWQKLNPNLKIWFEKTRS